MSDRKPAPFLPSDRWGLGRDGPLRARIGACRAADNQENGRRRDSFHGGCGNRAGGTVQGDDDGHRIWLAGALGLACGAGYGVLAPIASVLTRIVLPVLGRIGHAALAAGKKGERAADVPAPHGPSG